MDQPRSETHTDAAAQTGGSRTGSHAQSELDGVAVGRRWHDIQLCRLVHAPGRFSRSRMRSPAGPQLLGALLGISRCPARPVNKKSLLCIVGFHLLPSSKQLHLSRHLLAGMSLGLGQLAQGPEVRATSCPLLGVGGVTAWGWRLDGGYVQAGPFSPGPLMAVPCFPGPLSPGFPPSTPQTLTESCHPPCPVVLG